MSIVKKLILSAVLKKTISCLKCNGSMNFGPNFKSWFFQSKRMKFVAHRKTVYKHFWPRNSLHHTRRMKPNTKSTTWIPSWKIKSKMQKKLLFRKKMLLKMASPVLKKIFSKRSSWSRISWRGLSKVNRWSKKLVPHLLLLRLRGKSYYI
jgi:hypothetical protein